MPKPKPEATSTPKLLHVTGRKGIKAHEYEDSAQSPIGNYETDSPKISPYRLRSTAGEGRSPNLRKQVEHSGSVNRSYSRSPHHSPSRHRSHSPSETSSEEEQNYSEEEISENSRHVNEKSDSSVGMFLIFCFLLVVAVIVSARYFPLDSNSDFNLDTAIQNAENQFPKQNKDFWLHIKSNLKEINLLKQPKTIMFLYEANSEKTVNKILEKISSIAVCHVTKNCKNKAVSIEGDTLNKSEFIKDYGKIISKYQNDLKTNGVLTVKNLEKVPGTAAQAFHSICDDYNPTVQNALILFTVKVDKIPEKVYQLRFLETLFLKLWNNIGVDDKFYPLFTRITGTVMAVNLE